MTRRPLPHARRAAARDAEKVARDAFRNWLQTGAVDVNAALRVDPPADPAAERPPTNFVSPGWQVKIANALQSEAEPPFRKLVGHDRWLIRNGDSWHLTDTAPVFAAIAEWIEYRGEVAYQRARREAIHWAESPETVEAAGVEARAVWLALNEYADLIGGALGQHRRVELQCEYRAGVELRHGVKIDTRSRGMDFAILPAELDPRGGP